MEDWLETSVFLGKIAEALTLIYVILDIRDMRVWFSFDSAFSGPT
jgi:hypothetical protein